MTTKSVGATSRTTVRRRRDRGTHDRETIERIVDEALVSHVGFAVGSRPWVVPMLHGRDGDQVYFHGGVGNHLLRSLASGVEACATISLLDGIVLARSAFHHSVNYRSVMLFGTARLLTDGDEKRHALDVIVDHVLPGRAADARPGNVRELAQTAVVAVRITEASAKIRTGGPKDDPDDMGLEVWAGVLPLKTWMSQPVPDEALSASVATPDYIRSPRRPGWGLTP